MAASGAKLPFRDMFVSEGGTDMPNRQADVAFLTHTGSRAF
jgi:hypothetical protein